MALKGANLALILYIIVVSATVIASYDITKLLQNHGEFATFNDLLTRTGLAGEINTRKTITVLVVDNSGMGSISSKPDEVAKNILATHVILDYYDTKKLTDTASSNKSDSLTNLFQATGAATGKQGSLRVTISGNNVVLGSAADGGQQDSRVVKTVEAQPYDIIVLQISQPIITPGLDHISPTSSPKAYTPAQSPKKAHKSIAPSSDDGFSPASGPASSPSSDSSEAADEPRDKKKSPLTNEGARTTKVGGLLLSLLMGLGALTI